MGGICAVMMPQNACIEGALHISPAPESSHQECNGMQIPYGHPAILLCPAPHCDTENYEPYTLSGKDSHGMRMGVRLQIIIPAVSLNICHISLLWYSSPNAPRNRLEDQPKGHLSSSDNRSHDMTRNRNAYAALHVRRHR